MIEKEIATSDQKKDMWGYGEWVEEPDEVHWEYKGIKCRIHRQINLIENQVLGLGHLCGYVIVPKGHPWEKMNTLEIDCDVHGGLTYEENTEEGLEIGFDCAHYRDETPYTTEKILKYEMKQRKVGSPEYLHVRSQVEKMEEFNKTWLYGNIEKTYKNISFVKEQCESLVDQMLKAKEVTSG